MAKGDTFNVTSGDEIELTFQLNLKRAEIAKRNDADKHTHVTIGFSAESVGNAPPPGEVKFTALSAGADPNGPNEVLPITTDDPRFTRLYKVGIPRSFTGDLLDQMLVRVTVKTVPKEGELVASTLPADPILCKIQIRSPLAPKPPTR